MFAEHLLQPRDWPKPLTWIISLNLSSTWPPEPASLDSQNWSYNPYLKLLLWIPSTKSKDPHPQRGLWAHLALSPPPLCPPTSISLADRGLSRPGCLLSDSGRSLWAVSDIDCLSSPPRLSSRVDHTKCPIIIHCDFTHGVPAQTHACKTDLSSFKLLQRCSDARLPEIPMDSPN